MKKMLENVVYNRFPEMGIANTMPELGVFNNYRSELGIASKMPEMGSPSKYRSVVEVGFPTGNPYTTEVGFPTRAPSFPTGAYAVQSPRSIEDIAMNLMPWKKFDDGNIRINDNGCVILDYKIGGFEPQDGLKKDILGIHDTLPVVGGFGSHSTVDGRNDYPNIHIPHQINGHPGFGDMGYGITNPTPMTDYNSSGGFGSVNNGSPLDPFKPW